MGVYYNGRCYADAGQAADAAYGSAPIAQSVGPVSYTGQFVKTSGVWQWQIWTRDSSGILTQTQSVAPGLSLPVCDPSESFNDGIATGWGLAGAVLAAWGTYIVRRMLV